MLRVRLPGRFPGTPARGVGSQPRAPDTEAGAPRAKTTCSSHCGAGQGLLSRTAWCRSRAPCTAPRAAGPEGTAQRPWGGWSRPPSACCPTRCPLPRAPAGWVTDLPCCARDIPGFNTKSPASQETPRSQTDRDSWSPALQVAQPGAPGTMSCLERGQWTARCPPHLHTWLHAHLHPGERTTGRNANSSPHRALRSLPQHQGNAACPWAAGHGRTEGG